QQVPAHHQRGQHSHQGAGCAVRRIDDHRGLHGNHVRPARRATSSSSDARGRRKNGVTPVIRALAFMPLTVVLTTGVGFAQTPQAGRPAPGAPAAATVTPVAAAAPTVTTPTGVAAKTADAAEPQGFTYNPDGRRDPFVSLLLRGGD